MTIRSLYQHIVRLHPPAFRARFEQQMLSIFDESVDSRGGFTLVLDVVLSLFRQWLFRSHGWRRSPATMAQAKLTLDAIHERSVRLCRIAWMANVLWIIAVMVVLVTLRPPRSGDWSLNIAMTVTLAVTVYFTFWRKDTLSQLDPRWPGDFQSIQLAMDPRRAELIRRRDNLRFWMEGINIQGLITLTTPTAWFLMAFARGNVSWSDYPDLWSLFGLAIGLFGAFFLILRRLNYRTTSSLHEELRLLGLPEQ